MPLARLARTREAYRPTFHDWNDEPLDIREGDLLQCGDELYRARTTVLHNGISAIELIAVPADAPGEP